MANELFKSIEDDVNWVLEATGGNSIDFDLSEEESEADFEINDNFLGLFNKNRETLKSRVLKGQCSFLSVQPKNRKKEDSPLSEGHSVREVRQISKYIKTLSAKKKKTQPHFFEKTTTKFTSPKPTKHRTFFNTGESFSKQIDRKLNQISRISRQAPSQKVKPYYKTPTKPFFDRLNSDIHKRLTREERQRELEELDRIKAKPSEIRKTVERLTKDADRRRQDKTDNSPVENQKTKKYGSTTWEMVYKKRFEAFEQDRMAKLEDKIKSKRELSQAKEESELHQIEEKQRELQFKLRETSTYYYKTKAHQNLLKEEEPRSPKE